MSLRVSLLNPKAKVPTRGSSLAAGHDLYSIENIVLKARGRAVVSTGIAVAIPPGYYGRVAPRSGLAVKHGIDTAAGVIDADYRGELKVALFNLSDEDYEITEGERIAQFIVEQIYTGSFEVVESLENTERGAGGFGSSGTH